jgi:hypothetical protein
MGLLRTAAFYRPGTRVEVALAGTPPPVRVGEGRGASPHGKARGKVTVEGFAAGEAVGVRGGAAVGERVAVAGDPLLRVGVVTAALLGESGPVAVAGRPGVVVAVAAAAPRTVGVTVGRKVGVRSASSGEIGSTSVATGCRMTGAVAVASGSALAVLGWRLSATRLAAPRQYIDAEASRSVRATPSPTRCHSLSQSYWSHAQSSSRSSWALRSNRSSLRAALNDNPSRRASATRGWRFSQGIGPVRVPLERTDPWPAGATAGRHSAGRPGRRATAGGHPGVAMLAAGGALAACEAAEGSGAPGSSGRTQRGSGIRR